MALSCGVKDYNSTFFSFFKQLGLVHLLVVSGAHLAFIEKYLAPFFVAPHKVFYFWPLVVLIGYTLLSGAQPPVVRALFFYIFCLLNRAQKLNYSVMQCSVAAAVGMGMLFPQWLAGWSLVMSVLASFLIHLPVPPMGSSPSGTSGSSLAARVLGALFMGSSFFGVCTRMYVGLLPAVVCFGLPHPVSILVNWFFTPVFTVLLFPLSLLAYATGWLSPLADAGWQAAYFVLQNLGVPETLPPVDFSPLYKGLLWLYALAIAYAGIKLEAIASDTDEAAA